MKNKARRFAGAVYRIIIPIVDPIKLIFVFPGYFSYLVDLVKYSLKRGSEGIHFLDLHPVIGQNTSTTSFDPQYFYQGIWAFNKIKASQTQEHTDVGSQINLIGFLTGITSVKFVDIRPLEAELSNFTMIKGSILSLPFSDNSISSLSCLHVAEHIGLGRYGDPLDPNGTVKACRELARVLAPGGNLYFSLPVGKSRVCFNAHRVHSPMQILDYFKDLDLVEFSGVNDIGKLMKKASPKDFESCEYSLGLFHFTKK